VDVNRREVRPWREVECVTWGFAADELRGVLANLLYLSVGSGRCGKNDENGYDGQSHERFSFSQ
jgi:hypothetical protein